MRRDSQAASAVVQTRRSHDETSAATDSQLVQSFIHGADESAEAAFAALVERHGPIVQRVCLDVIGDLHDAQDAAQAVFLILARKARSIRKPESLGPWLHGVALRVARRVRSQTVRRKSAERQKADITTRQQGLAEHGHDSMGHDDLHNEINRLPEKYRLPIILCYMQGRTQPQAAQMLGWPLGTVQIRLHRGRERLRMRLSRAGMGLFALTGSDLTKSLSTTAGALDRQWAEHTARAAVRFAAGKTTTGLVAPPVAGLASSVLTAMLGDSLKALALIPIALLLIAGGLSLNGPRTTEVKPGNLTLESQSTTSMPQTDRQRIPNAIVRQASGETNGEDFEPQKRVPAADLKTRTAGAATPASPSQAPVIAAPPRVPVLDDASLSKPPSSSDRADPGPA